jgi:uncharacterized protein YidB (DUF937 family)
MGILDGILGSVLGGSSNAGPLQSILGSVLGGGQAQQQPGGQVQQQGGLGGTLGGMLGGGAGGGLGGLLGQFQQAGLGHVAQSWVGNGQNQQVSPDQLNQVFGDQQVNQWSQQTGMPKQDLLSQLSQYLPHAVDRMTPQGQVPAEAEGGSAFDGAGINLGTRTV